MQYMKAKQLATGMLVAVLLLSGSGGRKKAAGKLGDDPR
jgi:hypothetical protein